MARLEKGKQRELTDETFKFLQGEILRRRIPPNSPLTVAKTLTLVNDKIEDATKQVVANALHRLAIDGAVEIDGSAFRVIANNDPFRCQTLISARLIVESINIANLCKEQTTLDEVSFEKVNSIHETMSEIEKDEMTDDEKQQFVQADLDFHTSLADLAENPSSRFVISGAYYALLLAIHIPLPTEEDAKAIVREHQELLDAIRSKDVDTASTKLVRHLSEAVGRWHRHVTDFIHDDLRVVLERLCSQLGSPDGPPVPAPHIDAAEKRSKK